jgi:hypothetical protein
MLKKQVTWLTNKVTINYPNNDTAASSLSRQLIFSCSRNSWQPIWNPEVHHIHLHKFKLSHFLPCSSHPYNSKVNFSISLPFVSWSHMQSLSVKCLINILHIFHKVSLWSGISITIYSLVSYLVPFWVYFDFSFSVLPLNTCSMYRWWTVWCPLTQDCEWESKCRQGSWNYCNLYDSRHLKTLMFAGMTIIVADVLKLCRVRHKNGRLSEPVSSRTAGVGVRGVFVQGGGHIEDVIFKK